MKFYPLFMESYPLFTRYMGGINYQIEHHLFPSLSNHTLKEISSIVKKHVKNIARSRNSCRPGSRRW